MNNEEPKTKLRKLVADTSLTDDYKPDIEWDRFMRAQMWLQIKVMRKSFLAYLDGDIGAEITPWETPIDPSILFEKPPCPTH